MLNFLDISGSTAVTKTCMSLGVLELRLCLTRLSEFQLRVLNTS